jgi:hypothetical protein
VLAIAERGGPEDVVRARAAVRNAGVTYGPRTSRRSITDSWADFASRYGWRAYALPVLVVITVAALLTTNQVPRQHAPATAAPATAATPAPATQQGAGARVSTVAPPTASGSIALKDDTGGSSTNNSVLRAAALPVGAAFTMSGTGKFAVLPGSTKRVGTGRLYRYDIEVERGITRVNLTQFQRLVDTTLDDPRSWSGHGVSLQRVSSGPVDFRVSLTSAHTVRTLCGYSIPVETSCYASTAEGRSPVNRVVFDVARWVRGSTAYVGDLGAYRVYMINHEDGHALGHEHAHQCLPDGLAPVMMQQTFGLRSAVTDHMCAANPWPYPPNVGGAPGAEQPDTAANNEYGLGD